MSKTGVHTNTKHGGAHEVTLDTKLSFGKRSSSDSSNILLSTVSRDISTLPFLQTSSGPLPSFPVRHGVSGVRSTNNDGVAIDKSLSIVPKEEDISHPLGSFIESQSHDFTSESVAQALESDQSIAISSSNWMKSSDVSSISSNSAMAADLDFNILESQIQTDQKDSSSVSMMDNTLFTVIGPESVLGDNLQDLVFSSGLVDDPSSIQSFDTPCSTSAANDVKLFEIDAKSLAHEGTSLYQQFVVSAKSDETSDPAQLFHSSLDFPVSTSLATSSCSIGGSLNMLTNTHSSSMCSVSGPCEFLPSPSFTNELSQLTEKETFSSAEENLQQIFLPVSSSSLSSLQFPNIQVGASSLQNLGESGELSLSSLPNFLGLENSRKSSNQRTNQTLETPTIDHSSSLLNSFSLPNQTLIKSEDFNPQPSVSELTSQNLNVTTISISNEDTNATKILVNTNQDQPRMFVINTSNLTCDQTLQQGNTVPQMFVIKAAEPVKNTRSTIQISDLSRENLFSSDPPQAPATSMTTNDVTEIPGMPGFILLPVIDNSSNVIQPGSPAPPLEDDESIDLKTKKQKRILKCPEPGCNKTFKKSSKLKVHKMLHTGERPFKCTLLGCEWAFTTSHKLKRHLESHEGRKDFLCEHPGCGHRFTTIYNLNTHRKLHERPCTEPCPEKGCNMSFPTKRQLDLHLKNVHNYEDRTFKCPEPGCEKVFFSSGCMGSHMRVHAQNVEDLRCKFPGCGKMFTKMCRLRQHERLHTGEKPFVCDYEGCTWAFATASKLKRHQTKHTGVRKWTCHLCEKQFHRSEHLKGHLITHSGSRPFVCPVEGCGNTFTAKSSLYVHLKKHDESGKTIVYHCPMEKCERHYVSKASLRQHILVKHCSLPTKGSNSPNQGMVNWLSLLGPEPNSDVNLPPEAYGDAEGMDQQALASAQDQMMPIDFLSEEIQEQARLTTQPVAISETASASLVPQLVLTSDLAHTAVTNVQSVAGPAQVHLELQQSHQQQQQQQFLQDSQFQQQLIEDGLMLQMQEHERLSIEAVERGRKSQIMLENMWGSARTDPRSNDIISQRSLKRWQKQKEIEAAKLGAQLNAQNKPTCPPPIITPTSSAEYKNAVSNNVSLASQRSISVSSKQTNSRKEAVTAAKVSGEIPDMELQAEGIRETSLDGRPAISDAFMTELFVREPTESGSAYRQAQLLQDEPPNLGILEEIEGVAPTHNMVLDSSLEAHFQDDALNFQDFQE